MNRPVDRRTFLNTLGVTAAAATFTGRLDHGRILAANAVGLSPSAGAFALSVAGSQVAGIVTVNAPSTLRCVGDYDANDVALNGSCN